MEPVTRYAGLTLHLSLHKRAWYLDKFGMERECIVITGSGFVNGVLAVLGLDGQPLDVRPEDVYYVPQSAEADPPE